MTNTSTARRNAASQALLWSDICFNVLSVISWLLLCAFLVSQPWLANWANNTWAEYNTIRTQYEIENQTFTVTKYKTKFGICNTPLQDMICTDGQNFTELALKYRPDHLFGCGCGEGILGESLCPRTSYGFTLSDYVSTAPGLGAMLGLSMYPLMGAQKLLEDILESPQYRDALSPITSKLLYGSLTSFFVNFILWGIASVCVFPTSHALLTVTFLGSFMVFALTCLFVFSKKGERKTDNNAAIVATGALISFIAIAVGSIPRIFLTIDSFFMKPYLPDLNHGYWSYSFWLGEVIGLGVFFGLYPLVLIVGWTSGDDELTKSYSLVK